MIESAKWTPPGIGQDVSTVIIVVEDGVTKFVPDDFTNVDRQAIATWEAEGGTIAPADPVPPPPPSALDLLEARVAALEAKLP